MKSIQEFCKDYGLSVSFFYKMRHQGKAPKVTKFGRRCFITDESIKEWVDAATEDNPGETMISRGTDTQNTAANQEHVTEKFIKVQKELETIHGKESYFKGEINDLKRRVDYLENQGTETRLNEEAVEDLDEQMDEILDMFTKLLKAIQAGGIKQSRLDAAKSTCAEILNDMEA